MAPEQTLYLQIAVNFISRLSNFDTKFNTNPLFIVLAMMIASNAIDYVTLKNLDICVVIKTSCIWGRPNF